MRTSLALLPLFLLACGDKDTGSRVQDQDEDGFTADVDCDDSRPDVNPEAAEICDGVDNDCDGKADGRYAADAPIWYADLDGDGFGDALYPRADCVQPTGFVESPDDCNDLDDSINPDATEACNEVDDNCDGEIDEAGGGATWYLDEDGDGYGTDAATVEQCTQPSGYADNRNDCDDADATINPGATETWYDGVDGNCDEESDFDQDGDGYEASAFGGEDCNDTDSAIRPGVSERCDGVDEDCDGVVDEDPLVAPTWFYDSDSDGQGDPTVRERACSAPADYVDNALDCDDSDASVYEGAPETWYDGIDQDCDGGSDYDQDADGFDSDLYGGTDCDDTDASLFPTTYFEDADDDGYGDATSPLASCAVPSGYVLDDTDCDDSTDLANPGLSEVCGDGIDNDCDGLATGCGLLGVLTVGAGSVAGDEQARLDGDSVGDLVGSSVAILGDTDGDGVSDLALGSSNIAASGSSSGGVYVQLGVPTGVSSLVTGAVLLSGGSGDELGAFVMAASDQGGDGYADLLVGAPGADTAYLVSGPVTSSAAVSTVASFAAESAGASGVGGQGAALGRFDADGIDDLAVLDDGAVYLEAGPLSGTRTLGSGLAAVTGLTSGADLLVAAGDLNGDGIDDLVVSDTGAGVAGTTYTFLGPVSGALTAASADGSITSGSSGLLTSLTVPGDLDNDGMDDVLAGSSAYAGAGAAWLFAGPATAAGRVTDADVTVQGLTGDELGASVHAGDIDGDGVLDWILGAPGGGTRGEVRIWTGPLSGTLSSGGGADDGVIRGGAAADDFGGAVTSADANDDGFDDLLVGAPGANGDAINSGAGYLLLGGDGL